MKSHVKKILNIYVKHVIVHFKTMNEDVSLSPIIQRVRGLIESYTTSHSEDVI